MSAASPRAPVTLLLAHHGTPGAAAAADLARAHAVPGTTTVVHALVVPTLWAGMQGDDWLNNASTRDAFARHLEGKLEEDARAVVAVVEAGCREWGVACRSVVRVGEPAETVAEIAAEIGAELVVIGPPRKKSEPGLRSRMDLDILVRRLACPLLIANRA